MTESLNSLIFNVESERCELVNRFGKWNLDGFRIVGLKAKLYQHAENGKFKVLLNFDFEKLDPFPRGCWRFCLGIFHFYSGDLEKGLKEMKLAVKHLQNLRNSFGNVEYLKEFEEITRDHDSELLRFKSLKERFKDPQSIPFEESERIHDHQDDTVSPLFNSAINNVFKCTILQMELYSFIVKKTFQLSEKIVLVSEISQLRNRLNLLFERIKGYCCDSLLAIYPNLTKSYENIFYHGSDSLIKGEIDHLPYFYRTRLSSCLSGLHKTQRSLIPQTNVSYEDSVYTFITNVHYHSIRGLVKKIESKSDFRYGKGWNEMTFLKDSEISVESEEFHNFVERTSTKKYFIENNKLYYHHYDQPIFKIPPGLVIDIHSLGHNFCICIDPSFVCKFILIADGKCHRINFLPRIRILGYGYILLERDDKKTMTTSYSRSFLYYTRDNYIGEKMLCETRNEFRVVKPHLLLMKDVRTGLEEVKYYKGLECNVRVLGFHGVMEFCDRGLLKLFDKDSFNPNMKKRVTGSCGYRIDSKKHRKNPLFHLFNSLLLLKNDQGLSDGAIVFQNVVEGVTSFSRYHLKHQKIQHVRNFNEFSKTYQQFLINLYWMNDVESCAFSMISRDVLEFKIIPLISEVDTFLAAHADVLDYMRIHHFRMRTKDPMRFKDCQSTDSRTYIGKYLHVNNYNQNQIQCNDKNLNKLKGSILAFEEDPFSSLSNLAQVTTMMKVYIFQLWKDSDDSTESFNFWRHKSERKKESKKKVRMRMILNSLFKRLGMSANLYSEKDYFEKVCLGEELTELFLRIFNSEDIADGTKCLFFKEILNLFILLSSELCWNSRGDFLHEKCEKIQDFQIFHECLKLCALKFHHDMELMEMVFFLVKLDESTDLLLAVAEIVSFHNPDFFNDNEGYFTVCKSGGWYADEKTAKMEVYPSQFLWKDLPIVWFLNFIEANNVLKTPTRKYLKKLFRILSCLCDNVKIKGPNIEARENSSRLYMYAILNKIILLKEFKEFLIEESFVKDWESRNYNVKIPWSYVGDSCPGILDNVLSYYHALIQILDTNSISVFLGDPSLSNPYSVIFLGMFHIVLGDRDEILKSCRILDELFTTLLGIYEKTKNRELEYLDEKQQDIMNTQIVELMDGIIDSRSMSSLTNRSLSECPPMKLISELELGECPRDNFLVHFLAVEMQRLNSHDWGDVSDVSVKKNCPEAILMMNKTYLVEESPDTAIVVKLLISLLRMKIIRTKDEASMDPRTHDGLVVLLESLWVEFRTMLRGSYEVSLYVHEVMIWLGELGRYVAEKYGSEDALRITRKYELELKYSRDFSILNQHISQLKRIFHVTKEKEVVLVENEKVVRDITQIYMDQLDKIGMNYCELTEKDISHMNSIGGVFFSPLNFFHSVISHGFTKVSPLFSVFQEVLKDMSDRLLAALFASFSDELFNFFKENCKLMLFGEDFETKFGRLILSDGFAYVMVKFLRPAVNCVVDSPPTPPLPGIDRKMFDLIYCYTMNPNRKGTISLVMFQYCALFVSAGNPGLEKMCDMFFRMPCDVWWRTKDQFVYYLLQKLSDSSTNPEFVDFEDNLPPHKFSERLRSIKSIHTHTQVEQQGLADPLTDDSIPSEEQIEWGPVLSRLFVRIGGLRKMKVSMVFSCFNTFTIQTVYQELFEKVVQKECLVRGDEDLNTLRDLLCWFLQIHSEIKQEEEIDTEKMKKNARETLNLFINSEFLLKVIRLDEIPITLEIEESKMSGNFVWGGDNCVVLCSEELKNTLGRDFGFDSECRETKDYFSTNVLVMLFVYGYVLMIESIDEISVVMEAVLHKIRKSLALDGNDSNLSYFCIRNMIHVLVDRATPPTASGSSSSSSGGSTSLTTPELEFFDLLVGNPHFLELGRSLARTDGFEAKLSKLGNFMVGSGQWMK